MNALLSRLILAAGLAAITAALADVDLPTAGGARRLAAAELADGPAATTTDATADESPPPPTLLAQLPPPPPGAPPHPGRPPFAPPSAPRAMCEERIAREAGERAYLRTRLAPVGIQAEMFARYERAAQAAADRQAAFCATLPSDLPAMPPSLPLRLETMERELTGRLEALRATRGALAALWEVLTPEQRRVFDRPPPRPF